MYAHKKMDFDKINKIDGQSQSYYIIIMREVLGWLSTMKLNGSSAPATIGLTYFRLVCPEVCQANSGWRH